MSLELCILASGSMGNCSILRTPAGVVMIDAGIGPRTCARRLTGTGVRVADVRAICLTHLDSDHFRVGWISTIVSRGIAVHCHESQRQTIQRIVAQTIDDRAVVDAFSARVRTFDGQAICPLPELQAHAVQLVHDNKGSSGFVFAGHRQRVGYATDLGAVPPELLDHFAELNILAIESNYDPVMEMNSGRPEFVTSRIMGGRGHLSNQQAFDATCALLDRQPRPPDHIVLLHRSRQCNCPKLLRELFCRDGRIAPRLTLAEQFVRTEWLRSGKVGPQAGEQLTLSFEPGFS